MTADQLARRRDRLRDAQVKDREDYLRLRARLERRGRRIKNTSQRLRRKRRAEVKLSGKGRDFLIQEEGIVLRNYLDSAGHCTCCVGHLVKLGGCTSSRNYTREECEQLLAQDVKVVEEAVKACIHRPLAQHKEDALISLGFNIGTNGLKGSTVVDRINAGASEGAIREAWKMWRIPSELLPRRERELDLYFNADY